MTKETEEILRLQGLVESLSNDNIRFLKNIEELETENKELEATVFTFKEQLKLDPNRENFIILSIEEHAELKASIKELKEEKGFSERWARDLDIKLKEAEQKLTVYKDLLESMKRGIVG